MNRSMQWPVRPTDLLKQSEISVLHVFRHVRCLIFSIFRCMQVCFAQNQIWCPLFWVLCTDCLLMHAKFQALKTMFELYMRTENVHILLMVSENPPLSAPSSGTQPNWLDLDDARKKGKKVVEVEDDPEVKNMKAMADTLLSQIKRTDVGCDNKRGMRMGRDAILKRVSSAKQEKVESMVELEPVGDNVGL